MISVTSFAGIYSPFTFPVLVKIVVDADFALKIRHHVVVVR